MKNKRDDRLRQRVKLSPSKPPAGSGPATVELLLQRAVAHHDAGQFPEAEALYRQILEVSPNHSGALHLLGVIAFQVGQHAIAVELIDKAIQIHPDYAEAHCSRGNALYLAQEYQAAVESYDRAIRLKPENAEAYHNRGSAQHALKLYSSALESYDQALLLKPDYAEAHGNRASTLYLLQRYPEALESCDRAILINPDCQGAWSNRGDALQALERYEAAVESYDKAVLQNPNHAEAYNNRGSTLHALLRCEAALASYDQAILLKPDYADAHCNRGNALLALKQYQPALESFDKAMLLKPDCEYLLGMRMHMRRSLCDWAGIEGEARQLESLVERGERAALPFAILAVSDSPAVQRRAAEIYARDKYPACSPIAEIPRRPRRDRIRIGYFSADYYNHATSYLIAELLERHDRSRFEILGFSFGPDTVDEMGQRVAAAMDRFFDVRSMPERDIAQLSRSLEVDIAVDLKGFTRDSRLGIFAARAAPIQVNYLGYPGTMGTDALDYLIADPTLIPEASRPHYSEKIIYLPDSYQVNDSWRCASTIQRTRADEGLPEDAFVYCCFNTAHKITPDVFDIWMCVLGLVEGSVLWLLEDNPWAAGNLRKEAVRRGISPDRLVFARPVSVPEHLARQSLADLFLDTLPYNAHTTASDALWVGLPLLTRTGESFASRVGASLLRAVGLPELVTATAQEFEQLAVELALNPERYQNLRQRLRQNRLHAPLFDCQTFTLHLEDAYSAIYDRYQAGLPPEHIQIASRTQPALKHPDEM